MLPVDEKVARAITKKKLDDIARSGANAICLVCPFCAVMYDGNQKSIESEHEAEYGLPVLYLTQVNTWNRDMARETAVHTQTVPGHLLGKASVAPPGLT